MALMAMACITGLAALYDGQVLYLAVGAMAGLVGGHGLGRLSGYANGSAEVGAVDPPPKP